MTVCVAVLIVLVRAKLLGLEAIEKLIPPLPNPLADEVIVIHGALLVAVQGQSP